MTGDTRPSDVDPVVIVGAGPVGVAAATLLGQYGVRCLVLDRWEDLYPQPRAVHLDDEVCRILDRLGVLEQFASISRPAKGLRLVDPERGVLATFERSAGRGRHGHPQANMFDQPELERLLRANLERQPTVRVRGNAEVVRVVPEPTRVRVDLVDRVSGSAESVHASYVLGCDGANSVVRDALGVAMDDLGFEQRWLVVDVATPVELGQWDGVHQVCDPHRAATYMRIGEARYRWEFRLLAGEAVGDFTSLEALQPLLAPWVGGVSAGQLELVRVAEYTFRAQVAEHWREGRVFLLGDAAHLTPPFIGQGLCAGLRDAMNLSWKLAGVLDNRFPDGVLDSYEAERKPHVRALIGLARLVGVLMTRGGRAGLVLRRMAAPRLHHAPGLRQRLLDGETPRLSRSALVVRQPLQRLPGRLCPNVPLVDGSTFDDAGDGRFVLVTRQPLDDARRDQLASLGVRLVEVAASSPLGRWLASGRASAALVRPDHTVMCAGRRADLVLDEAVRRWDHWSPERVRPALGVL
ncbi:MAG TPA: bifunctional 3-(3-hydroxy-phenyl)propionate/3-hydroxycinnamic acid hydroxylase [Marmoricola sp.]|nr:bifunctional 3-(3-hydroxy-phenyl)propionate/3-hydroxycinnamic acid hydroxylase [Marmoricola sp.]